MKNDIAFSVEHVSLFSQSHTEEKQIQLPNIDTILQTGEPSLQPGRQQPTQLSHKHELL
jgi:hypothetical protein